MANYGYYCHMVNIFIWIELHTFLMILLQKVGGDNI